MVEFGVATRLSARSGMNEFLTDEKWKWPHFLHYHLKIKPPFNREPLKKTTFQNIVDQQPLDLKYHKSF